MSKHVHTWFPLILFGLSLALLLLVWIVFAPQVQEQRVIENPEVTVEDYQNQARVITRDFFDQYNQTTDQPEQENLVTSARNDLLALLVPGTHRDVHLELVVSLNLIEQGLAQADAAQVTEGERRLEAVITQYGWLQ